MKRITALALLMLFVLAFTGCTGSGPTFVVRQYIRKSAEGDIAGAKSYCTGGMLKLIEKSEQLAAATGISLSDFMAQMMGGLDWKDVKDQVDISLTSKTSAEAKVKVVVEAKISESAPTMNVEADYTLIKVDGQWKISDMALPMLGGSITDLM